MYDYKVNKYPWLVRIWERKKYAGPSSSKITYADEYPGRGFCGGTLVARRHVITAAHCLYNTNRDGIVESQMFPHEIAVKVGDHNIEYDDDDTRLPSRFINVVDLWMHDRWDQDIKKPLNAENGFDIAILKLEIDLSLKTYTPACLAKNWADPPFGQYGIAVGWGAISEFPSYKYPEVPHEVSLRIEPRDPRGKCTTSIEKYC